MVCERGLTRAAWVVTPSRFSRAELVRHAGVPAARIVVVPYGVSHDFCPGPADTQALAGLGLVRPFVLSVGLIQPRKNMVTALRAFEDFADRHPHHELAVVGGRGWRSGAFVSAVARSRHRDRVRLLGRVSEHELLSLYRGAGCLLFGSRYEGFGLPIVEAMACGTPVIAGAFGPAPELVGGGGLLVDVTDPAAMSRALETALDLSLRAELSAAAVEESAAFSWERCARETTEIYESAC
jgi:alpha-1,3-rhamnosyl/mannosyltransferase